MSVGVPEHVTLSRDCEAILIPNGVPLKLTADTEVLIVQALGGSYTINVNGNLARVSAQDADALGKPMPVAPDIDPDAPLEDQIWAHLKTCFDPEIPVNIVDLGLVYDVRVLPGTAEATHRVEIDMTLTAPGCGMGPVLATDVQQKINSLAAIEAVAVELVFEPTWHQGLMSDAAKLQLGFL